MTTAKVKTLVQDTNAGKVSGEYARRILASTRWVLCYNHRKEKYYVRALQGIPHYRGR